MIKIDKVKVDWSRMPRGLTWMLIGAPKTGKTTQASKWSEKGPEGVLIIDADIGTDFVDGCNRVTVTSLNPPEGPVKDKDGNPVLTKEGELVVDILPPEQRGYVYRTGEHIGKPMPVYSLAEVIYDLMENWNDYGIDTIVIDTVDAVNDWIEREVAPNGMGSKGFGLDWSQARSRNMDIIQKLQSFLRRVGGTLVLISHSKKTSEVDGKIQLMPDLPSGLAGRMCAKADVIGFVSVNKKQKEHTISFMSYDERSVGSRLSPIYGKELKFDYETIKEAITGKR